MRWLKSNADQTLLENDLKKACQAVEVPHCVNGACDLFVETNLLMAEAG